MPTSIYVMFIDSEAKNGHLQKNPYVFEHCNLSEIRCYLGSHILPSVLYKLNPNAKQVDMTLLDTYIALGCDSSFNGPAQLIRENLTNGVFIAGFDLSRDNQPISNYHNSSFDASTVGLEGIFSVATQKAYTSMGGRGKSYMFIKSRLVNFFLHFFQFLFLEYSMENLNWTDFSNLLPVGINHILPKQ